MQEERNVGFGKWLLKITEFYAVFIIIGMPLSLVPAGWLGLSEEMFFNLRMFFMLLGPVYLTLIVKIMLTLLAAVKGRTKDVARETRVHISFYRSIDQCISMF